MRRDWPAAKAAWWGWRARRHGAAHAGVVCDGAAGAAAVRCHVPAVVVRGGAGKEVGEVEEDTTKLTAC